MYTNPSGLGLGEDESLVSQHSESCDLNQESVPMNQESTQEARTKNRDLIVSLKVDLKIFFVVPTHSYEVRPVFKSLEVEEGFRVGSPTFSLQLCSIFMIETNV